MKKLFLFLLWLFPALLFSQNGITTVQLPSSYSTDVKNTLTIDNAGRKWIGFTNNGAARYNGTWTYYTTSNSSLPSNNVQAIAFSGSDTWFGTKAGAAFFDGSNWTIYNTGNSGIASDSVTSIFVHNTDTWFGTENGLSKFDGTNWTTYTTANSGLPVNSIYSVGVTPSGDVWAGTKNGGLAHFNGSAWTVYTATNSTLSNNYVKQVYIDNTGSVWSSSGPVSNAQEVQRFTGGVFESPATILAPQYPFYAAATSRGNIGTGWQGTAAFKLVMPNFSTGPVGYAEMTSPLNIYALPVGTGLRTFVQSSTGHTWFVFQQGAQLYELDPALHSSIGLLTADNTKALDINEVSALMLNRGDMHWNTTTNNQYEVPKGGAAHTIFSSSLWIGGLDAGGNLHQAAMTYRQTGMDFFPGPLDTTTGMTDSLVADAYDYIWKIDRLKIQEFQYYWSTGAVQNQTYTPEADIISWPGSGNGNHMRTLAPYVDVNNNGVYDPLTGGDYPDITGDQMLYWIFNDNLSSHTETGGLPLGVEIHASAYAFYCPGIPDSNKVLNYTTYYHFDIYNWSGQPYAKTFVGMYQDCDLGDFQDDYVGCYPPANVAYAYNGDLNDGSSALPTVGTYGASPPISSLVMLDGPPAVAGDTYDNDNDGTTDEAGERNLLTGFLSYSSDFTIAGNPESADDFYNYSSWKWKDSTNWTYGGNGYGGTTPTHFLFPDLPYNSAGWNEPTTGNVPSDRRFLASCGPFDLNPAIPVSIDYAIVYTRDTNLQITDPAYWNLMLSDAAKVRTWRTTNSEPSCIQWSVGIDDPATGAPVFSLFPNPASTLVTIEYTPSAEDASFELLDLTGRVVKTGKLNAHGQTVIGVEELSAGIYVVRVIDNGASSAVKFIRQ
jgi:hypothetical protein